MTETIESKLRFPDPMDYYHENHFNIEEFTEEYESCLIELGIILEKIHDPLLHKKIENLLREVLDWVQ